ncbi:unnamed protein product [Rotaria sp. Silwood1]|nr:unnamed protein product [Rotaria sp. Silwood1]CAF1022229.1 unnamed protein product [Rotaria sp. Silwood1]CAF1097280.1 unnamed protein product [Rotaria sp. Silwood1]CAF3342654.1 unnamed protein product [Rotaria sp. Silwood1]CAF3365888.1 unnamed protein product [Rotaria sp. Silwood1]
MQNVKSYFSSWKPFWKSSTNSCHSRTLTLAPSNINFTSSSLGDLKHSVIDEKLMIDISTKLMESDCPPKLQICAHNNQWFALNNSHLLVYRQLERIGLCDTVVCDIIRSQDVPIGIRQTLTPVTTSDSEHHQCFQHSRGRSGDHYMLMDEERPQSQDEILYCADAPIDSCGCFEGEDQCDCSVVTYGESDHDGESDDEQTDDNYGEWQTSSSLPVTQISTISHNRLDDIDNEDDLIEDNQKEMQSLL